MNRIARLTMMSFAAFAAAGFTAAATDRRVEERVDASIRSFVAAIVDSLEQEGVTPEPVIQYALEGTLKLKLRQGNPQVILVGVRKWAGDLRRARQLLGPNANEHEISAGAKAIRAGVDERQLLRFRDVRKEQRYAFNSALSTMTHLIKRGVPADTAANALINIAILGASDTEIRTLQDEIERDINGGVPAGLSAVAREQGLRDAINAGRGSGDGVVPGTTIPSTRGTARPGDPLANPNARGSAVGNKGDAARPPAPRGKDTKRP